VSFVFDQDRRVVVDPTTGDTLKQERIHYQDPRWFQTIFDSDGMKRFSATIHVDADGTLANPAKPGDHVLMSTVRYDDEGRPSEMYGPDPDLDRIIEYIRDRADPVKPFTFTDARK